MDNESFLSLAISTAIDELQEDQVANTRPQESAPASSDFCSHVSLPLHPSQGFSPDNEKGVTNLPVLQPHQNAVEFPVSLRRSCEEQEEESQQPQYDMCHLAPSNVMFSHQTSGSNVVSNHPHINDDSIERSNIPEEGKFSCNAQDHFSQANMRNMTVWHQEGIYGNEESQSSDSGHMYQRQVYDQGFNLKLSGPSDTYNGRANQNSSYPARDNVLKGKQNFANAVSYYVSTYNPEDDMTVSDDQSTQSFQYDENFNAGMNFYPCRLMEMKEAQHGFMEPLRNQDGYSKTYYPSESNDTQDMANVKREMYYNDNSTDTQLSNCPQDMTIQNQQFSQCPKDRPDILQKKEMLVTEYTSNIAQSDCNMPISLVTEQQHFDHYAMENSGGDEEFHRDMTRSSCESVPATLPCRENIAEVVTSESKRAGTNSDIDIRNYGFVKDCVSEQKDLYKETSPKDRSAAPNVDILEQNASNGDSSNPTQDNAHVLTSLDSNVIPRHVKFKISRNINVSLSGKRKKYSVFNLFFDFSNQLIFVQI